MMQTVNDNRLLLSDRAVHDWYRFVLSFPPHLVRKYLEKFSADPKHDVVFDPFCGTGTTLVEAKKAGFEAIGVEANEMAMLASTVKTNWNTDPVLLERTLDEVLHKASEMIPNEEPLSPRNNANAANRLASPLEQILSPEKAAIIPRGFISHVPLTKVLAIKASIEQIGPSSSQDLMKLALAETIVKCAGNVGFGPEVYRTKSKEDAPVLEHFSQKVRVMASDLRSLRHLDQQPTRVYSDDARQLQSVPENSVSVVITSPPYPNEKDYTRTTRLESVLLDLIKDKKHLRELKNALLRSNTRNVFQGDSDSDFITKFPRVLALAQEVEDRRIALNKTSGFERLYTKVVLHYFGGMYRHLSGLWSRLRPGAKCAYVVGDQMSYFRIPIRTGAILSELASDIGYDVLGRDLWRTRKSTATGADLTEEVLLFSKPA